MQFGTKRADDLKLEDVQQGNKSWWTSQTMSYDWHDKVTYPKFSLDWFNEIDARFLYGARLISSEANPFHKLMEDGALAGKRVLEIGCGMGFHAEMLAKSGAILTTIDISPTSVDATRNRFALKGLSGDVVQMDAEKIDFPDNTFDMVWSWGVIHHSSRTGRIIREIERVLKPGGVAKLMVYNVGGTLAYLTLMTKYSYKFWMNKSIDEVLWECSDGFTARFYTKDIFADQLFTFFPEVTIEIMGQEADAIPLPMFIRRHVRRLFSDKIQSEWARRRGFFLYATARKSV